MHARRFVAALLGVGLVVVLSGSAMAADTGDGRGAYGKQQDQPTQGQGDRLGTVPENLGGSPGSPGGTSSMDVNPRGEKRSGDPTGLSGPSRPYGSQDQGGQSGRDEPGERECGR